MPARHPHPGRSHPRKWRNRIVGHAEIDPATIVEHPDNWRLHPRLQQQALAGVLDDVGWVQCVVINRRTGHVVDGHLRRLLALQRGETTVPVIYVDLDEAEEATILATLDPIGGLARTDADALQRTLASVAHGNGAVERLLERVAASAGLRRERDGATDPDDLPVAPAPRARPGDRWILGDHCLLCGDATDATLVGELMGAERAALVATDPPFFVDYDGTNHPGRGPTARTPLPRWDRDPGEVAVTDFYAAFLTAALAVSAPGVAVYQWHAERRRAQVERAGGRWGCTRIRRSSG